MSHSVDVDDERRVFLAYRRLFSEDNAHIRSTRRIEKLVKKYKRSVPRLLEDLGFPKTVEILQELLEQHIFESDTHTRAAFPELFNVSPVRTVQRAASENEAARSEVEALKKLAPGVKLKKNKTNDQKTLPKQEPINLAPKQDPIITAPKQGPIIPVPKQEPLKPVPKQELINLVRKQDPIIPVPKQEPLKSVVLELPKPPEPEEPSLYPIYISYKVEYLILATIQRLLEECCFEFAVKWAPALLEREGWDCPEAAELTAWTRNLDDLSDKLPADAISNKSKIPLHTIFVSTTPIRHSAVHRPPTSAKGIQEMIQSAIQLAVTLGDTTRSASLELVKASFDARIMDMHLNKNFLENRLDEQLQFLREQRAELDRKETEAVATMFRMDLENKLTVSSNLEASVREAFGLDREGSKMDSGSGILPVSEKNDKNSMGRIGESSEGEDSDDEVDIFVCCSTSLDSPPCSLSG